MHNHRSILTYFGLFCLGVFAWIELYLFYPVAWWLYAGLLWLFALDPLLIAPGSRRRRSYAKFGILAAVIAALYFTPWTSRKKFLHALNRIRPGMSESKVRHVMFPYEPQRFYDNDGNPRFSFIHSDHPAFNADVGVVNFRDGKVVDVVFWPD